MTVRLETKGAGADLGAFARREGNVIAPDGHGPMGPTRMLLSKPVIAAVAGHAVAGGLELALFCDLRVMEEDAVFGVPLDEAMPNEFAHGVGSLATGEAASSTAAFAKGTGRHGSFE
jgi:enoyl-CoA hydratase/carnithine racemase